MPTDRAQYQVHIDLEIAYESISSNAAISVALVYQGVLGDSSIKFSPWKLLGIRRILCFMSYVPTWREIGTFTFQSGHQDIGVQI
jgi:hypothetical protein